MTLEELYREIAGNYQDIRERLRKEARIERFVLLFLKDTSYQTMRQAWEQGEMEEAFRAVHTLKGICMNLSFDELFGFASEMTECLRAGDAEGAAGILPELEKSYEKHVQMICKYKTVKTES